MDAYYIQLHARCRRISQNIVMEFTWIHQAKTLHILLLDTSIYFPIAGTKNNTTSAALLVKYIAAATI